MAARAGQPRPVHYGEAVGLSHQLHALQAGMAVFADDDVIVHRNAERAGDVDDRFRHLDVGGRRCRVAGGKIVHENDGGRR